MLKKGDQLPDITLKNQAGESVALRNFIGKNALVIYFYPKDETPGCTREACHFRDDYEAFTSLGAKVFGISADSVDSHKKFAQRLRLSFDLLSDEKKQAEKAFKVPRNLFGLLPGRVTFIIDKEGVIQHVYNSAVNMAGHVKHAMDALKRMS